MQFYELSSSFHCCSFVIICPQNPNNNKRQNKTTKAGCVLFPGPGLKQNYRQHTYCTETVQKGTNWKPHRSIVVITDNNQSSATIVEDHTFDFNEESWLLRDVRTATQLTTLGPSTCAKIYFVLGVNMCCRVVSVLVYIKKNSPWRYMCIVNAIVYNFGKSVFLFALCCSFSLQVIYRAT